MENQINDHNFTEQAVDILRDRYLWKDSDGSVIETPVKMLDRVAKAIATVETDVEKNEYWSDRYFDEMYTLRFLPNSPTLMNAGRPAPHGQLAACFVIGVEDNMPSICEALRKQMLIQKSGGGTGFNFSKLRSSGSKVNSTNGKASGPISFMKLFDQASETVQQGGMRRGANMGILNIDHSDIKEFVHCKDNDSGITNFNISVGITDDWMYTATYHPDSYEREVLYEIAESAWKTGDPGVLFIDTIEAGNTTPALGRLDTTNPCGESPLYPDEACNLGSIDVSKFWNDGIDEDRLRETVETAVRFLDSVIDVSSYPLPEVAESVKRTRKIGLGIMGWADLLFIAGAAYGSSEAEDILDELMMIIEGQALTTSRALGEERGIPSACTHLKRRNATLTCIAPTGTIALLADCSSGIEPVFGLEHTRVRTQVDGTKVVMKYKNKHYQKAIDEGYDDEHLKRVFITASEISPSKHIKTQSLFQKYTHLAVSKTINMDNSVTVDDILNAYIEAWQSKCKGITIYRDGSKSEQVLYHNKPTKKQLKKIIK